MCAAHPETTAGPVRLGLPEFTGTRTFVREVLPETPTTLWRPTCRRGRFPRSDVEHLIRVGRPQFRARQRLSFTEDAMREIRICWTPDVEHEPHGVFRDGGFWYGDFQEPRRALSLIVRAENAKHGVGTHWIEERDAPNEPTGTLHGAAPDLEPEPGS